MKVQTPLSVVSIAVASMTSATCSAFCPRQLPNMALQRASSSLQAKATHETTPWWGAAVTVAVGWSLVSQMALASSLLDDQQMTSAIASSSSVLSGVPTLVSEPPQTYDKLDFSLPSYESSSFGFGQGTEIWMEKAGGTEADKQAEAMKKAEEARKARLTEKRQALKRQEEADKAKARLKQEEGQERMKALFN